VFDNSSEVKQTPTFDLREDHLEDSDDDSVRFTEGIDEWVSE